MNRRLIVATTSFVFLPFYASIGCGDTDPDSGFKDRNAGGSSATAGTSGNNGGTSSGGTNSGGSSSGGSAGTLIGVSGAAGSSAGASGTGGNGTPELCDGIDNDANGIIDDVDKGHDGICDCLRIATLGELGTWGEGDVFTGWLNSRSDNGAVNLHDVTLTATELNKHQVIVVQDVRQDSKVVNRTYSAAEVQALKDWVDAGGGLMTLIGYAESVEVANVNVLLAPYGISYGPEQILKKGGGSTVPVTTWFPHPTSAGITQIGVDNGYPVNGSGTLVARGTERDDSSKIWDMARAKEVSKGHVFVWGDEWITYNSEWKDHPDYQVERFWLSVIKWLTPQKQCQVAIPPLIE